jgi:hypothetical protein
MNSDYFILPIGQRRAARVAIIPLGMCSGMAFRFQLPETHHQQQMVKDCNVSRNLSRIARQIGGMNCRIAPTTTAFLFRTMYIMLRKPYGLMAQILYVKVKSHEPAASHSERSTSNLMLPELWQRTNIQACMAMNYEGDAEVKMLLLLSLNYSRL